MPPSDNRSSILTCASAPAPRNDSPSVSPSSTATLRAVGPNRDLPPSFPAPVNLVGRGPSIQRYAEPRIPVGGPPSPDHSSLSPDSPRTSTNTSLRQQGALREDWGSPTFIQEQMTSLDRRLSTVTSLVQQQVDSDKEASPYSFFSKLTEVAAEMKADLKRTQDSIKESVDASVEEKLAEFRQQIKADRQEALDHTIQTLQKQMKADQEEIVRQSVTKTLGAMSINLTGMVENVATLNEDVRGIKTVLRNVQSTSANVAEELNTSLTHVRRELGLPVAEEVTLGDVFDPTVVLLETSQSSAHVAITSTDSDVPTTPASPDVPTTPTAPETPTVSDASSTMTGRGSSLIEERTFSEAASGLLKLYKLLKNKRRTP